MPPPLNTVKKKQTSPPTQTALKKQTAPKKQTGSKKRTDPIKSKEIPPDHLPPDHLHEKAFDNSLRANIIFRASDGGIIKANRAVCKLLGYSKKELLTKNRKDIFSVSESSYKKMLRQRKTEGGAKADLSVIRKNGGLWPCEITSVAFKDDNGVGYSIMSFVDLRERLLKQKPS